MKGTDPTDWATQASGLKSPSCGLVFLACSLAFRLICAFSPSSAREDRLKRHTRDTSDQSGTDSTPASTSWVAPQSHYPRHPSLLTSFHDEMERTWTSPSRRRLRPTVALLLHAHGIAIAIAGPRVMKSERADNDERTTKSVICSIAGRIEPRSLR